MARLAEYMGELSRLLGEPNAVHFNRLEPGSTVLVSQVEHEAIPKVRARTNSVRRGEGPSEAVRAFKQINKLLREDNAVGFLHDKTVDAVVIRFPGREEPEEKFPVIRQQGSIDGVVSVMPKPRKRKIGRPNILGEGSGVACGNRYFYRVWRLNA